MAYMTDGWDKVNDYYARTGMARPPSLQNTAPVAAPPMEQAFYGTAAPTGMSYAPGGVQIQGGGLQNLPTFDKSMIGWMDAEAPQWSTGSDTDPARQIYAGREAGYGFTGGNNDFYSSPFYRNTNNYEWTFDPTTGAPSVRVKSGDKTGTTVKYVQDASGNWVPDYSQQTNNTWNTNEGNNEWLKILSVPAIGLGAYGAASALGVAGGAAGAGSGVGTGLTAAEAAALGSEAAGGITGIGAGGTTAAEAAAAAGLPGSAAASVPFEAGFTASAASPVATTAAEGGSVLSSIQQAVKAGMPVLEAIQKFGGALTGQSGSGGGRGLLDLLGAYYSAQQNKDYAGNLKGIYSDLTARQNQFRDQLLASYQDPNTFYNSNQWKGLESVYQNQVDRQAATKGRLANPTDREVLLQKHAMQELEKYRSGLKEAAGLTRPEAALDPLAKGYQAEAWANSPLFTATGGFRAGGAGGGGVGNVVNMLAQAGSTAADIWKLISGWFEKRP